MNISTGLKNVRLNLSAISPGISIVPVINFIKQIVIIALILFISCFASVAEEHSLLPGEEEFLIGLIPEENIFTQMKRHKPLAEYLSEKLGLPVRFTILSRYPHIITRFVTRHLDGAFFGAFTGVLAQETLFVEPIARPVGLDGNMTTNGYIFTRVGSGIDNLAGMRGKSIAYVDQVTASGYLYALYLLKTHGVKELEGFFKREEYTGGHDTALYTVLAGRADIGVAKARIVDRIRKRDPFAEEEIRILYKSPDLPDNTFSVRKDLPDDFKLKLKNILLSMHKDSKGQEVLKLFSAMQFTTAEADDFEPVYRMTRQVGIDLKKFKYDY